jgi:hypothetical protein
MLQPNLSLYLLWNSGRKGVNDRFKLFPLSKLIALTVILKI